MTTKRGQLENQVIKGVVEKVITEVKENYIFPEKAQLVSELLSNNLNQGLYNHIIDGEEFAKTITENMQEVTHDKHLRLRYSIKENSEDREISAKEIQEELRRKSVANNYGFYRVERLDGNIGYIDLRMFEDPSIAGETAISAMNILSNTEALIFDLRKNGGGSPQMIALLTTYLFAEPTHLNNFYYRPENSMDQTWTLPYVPGKRYLDKPVYVLTSHYTFSAGEEFTYDLKNLKRATIVGEVTGGGAHPGGFQQITKNFRMFIPNGRAINPITNTNWEGTGVEPDINVSEEEALNTAYKEALAYIENKYINHEDYQFLYEEAKEKLKRLR